MSKVPSDVRHKVTHFEVIDPELLEVCECGEVAEGARVKPFGGEADRGSALRAGCVLWQEDA